MIAPKKAKSNFAFSELLLIKTTIYKHPAPNGAFLPSALGPFPAPFSTSSVTSRAPGRTNCAGAPSILCRSGHQTSPAQPKLCFSAFEGQAIFRSAFEHHHRKHFSGDFENQIISPLNILCRLRKREAILARLFDVQVTYPPKPGARFVRRPR